MPLKISACFDAGAIHVVRADLPSAIDLELRSDSHADFRQWFYFRVQGAAGQPCTMRFLNAGQAAYPGGWEQYQAVASYDRIRWFRVPTDYDGQVLTVRHTPQRDSVYYAYFEPYTWERHLDLLGRTEASGLARVEDLGNTVDGRDLNLVVVGNPAAQKKIWVIARQHPGETMAEWLVEGMLDALLDPANPIARTLLQRVVFYIMPNMNPDGAVRGNLRTNAAGANLNREWMTPSLEKSPEVYYVKNRIHQTGCDIFLDIHGDETLPYVFVAGCEMLENFTARQANEQQLFIDELQCSSADFQTEVGYAPDKYHADMLTLASKYIGHAFQCVSLTLELPFKDNANAPQAETGWNGVRSKQLGRDLLSPILHTLDHLKY